MSIALDTSNWINLGILGVTGLAGWLAWRAARHAAKLAHADQLEANAAAGRSAAAAEQSNAIQRRLVDIEEKRESVAMQESVKAALRAELVREETKFRIGPTTMTAYILVVRNAGPAPARNLDIRLGGKPIKECSQSRISEGEHEVVIGPGAELRLPVAPQWPMTCELSWDDDSAVRGNWRSTLS